jgi:hypothetical protein
LLKSHFVAFAIVKPRVAPSTRTACIKASKPVHLDDMRTTITLDDDVAALIQRVERKTRASFKEVVNRALRIGLQEVQQPVDRPVFESPVFDVGECLIGNIDDISEALELAEGPSHR